MPVRTAPFVDFDLIDANRISAAWLNAVDRRINAVSWTNVTEYPYYARGDGTAGSDFAALQNAINEGTSIYLPPGIYDIGSSTIQVPSNRTIFGFDRVNTVVRYSGLGNAFNIVPETSAPSGSGRVTFSGFCIQGTGGVLNTGAGLNFLAHGWSYYQVDQMLITGNFCHGAVFDGTEVSGVTRSIIENGFGLSASLITNVWCTNGADWTSGQGIGLTNVFTLYNSQLNNGTNNYLDDGGDNRWLVGNNFNGAVKEALRIAGLTNLVIQANDIENANAAAAGEANILFYDTSSVLGFSVGPVLAGRVNNVYCGNDMAAGGRNIKFAASNAANFHQVDVENTKHRNNGGRSAAIDVTQLRWSKVIHNVDEDDGFNFFTGVHNDANGNLLFAPPNSADTKAYRFGMTNVPVVTHGGLDAQAGGILLLTQKMQNFVVQITNTGGTLQHRIVEGVSNVGGSAHADKIVGASSSLTNTPTVDSTHDFAAGVGINGSNIVFNTAAQTSANFFAQAVLESYDGNVTQPAVVYPLFNSRNVNGTTANRLELAIGVALTSGAWTIDTTNIPSGKSVWIRFSGFLA